MHVISQRLLSLRFIKIDPAVKAEKSMNCSITVKLLSFSLCLHELLWLAYKYYV